MSISFIIALKKAMIWTWITYHIVRDRKVVFNLEEGQVYRDVILGYSMD